MGGRAFTVPKIPEVARLRDETRSNVDDLERRVKVLEGKTPALERLAVYVRNDLYDFLVALAAFVAFPTSPPEPPDR